MQAKLSKMSISRMLLKTLGLCSFLVYLFFNSNFKHFYAVACQLITVVNINRLEILILHFVSSFYIPLA